MSAVKKSGDDFSMLADASADGFAIMAVDLIDVENQIRTEFLDESLQELAESVLLLGILEPLIIRPMGSRYRLVAGERRLRAAIIAGLDSVPVLIKEMDDERARAIQAAENIHREDLTLLDLAREVKKDLAAANGKRAVILLKYNKSDSWLSKIIGVTELPKEAKALVTAGVTKDMEVLNIVAKQAKEDKKTGGTSAKAVVDAVVKEAAKKPAERKNLRDVAKDTAAIGKPAKSVKPANEKKTGSGLADPYTEDLKLGKPVEKAFGNVPFAKSEGGGEKRSEISEVLVDCSRHFKAIEEAIAELKSMGNISESARAEIADKLDALKARALGKK